MEKVSSECGKKHKAEQAKVNRKKQLLRLPGHQGSANGNKQVAVSENPEGDLQGIG